MPIYLITIHTYRSWSEDHPRGYVQRGQQGIQPPQPRLAAYRAAVAADPPVRLDRRQMRIAVEVAHEVCVNLDECPIAASCTATHLHVLVEMRMNSNTPNTLCARIKSIVGCRLTQQLGTKGNRWFSRGKDITMVKNDAHLRHLVSTYLPRHESREGGVFVKWD